MKQVVTVDSHLGVTVQTVEDSAFDQMSEAITQNYPAMLRALTDMQVELLALKDGSGNAPDFIQRHALWLVHLSRIGFAVEVAQFAKK
jgi:hypothetical protein